MDYSSGKVENGRDSFAAGGQTKEFLQFKRPDLLANVLELWFF